MAWKLCVSGNGRWIEEEDGRFVCGAVRPDLADLLTAAPDLLTVAVNLVNAVDLLHSGPQAYNAFQQLCGDLVKESRRAIAIAQGKADAKAEGIQGVRPAHAKARKGRAKGGAIETQTQKT